MSKITLILPYFGNKFPTTFPLLLDSMKKNIDIQFLIFTNIKDEILEANNASNISIEYTTLANIRKLASSKLNINVNLYTPYKLCDLRPFYGIVFEDYLKKSEWWGYFDSDIIFGNLNSFIKNDVFQQYDRIFTHGHLTFYRNNRDVNNVVLHDFSDPAMPDYKRVLTDKETYGFDEWGFGKNKGRGISWEIDKTKVLEQYDNLNLFADILPGKFNFETTANQKFKYFIYDKGNLFATRENNSIVNLLYAHFQKRPMIYQNIDLSHKIYIFSNYFTNDQKYKNSKEEKKRWENFYIRYRIKHVIKNMNLSYLKKRISFFNSEK